MPRIITLGSEKFIQEDMEELLKKTPDKLKNNPAFLKDLESLASTKIPYWGPPNEHVLATPLVEVLAVSIHSYDDSTLFDDGKPCDVYGVIQATGVGKLNSNTRIDLYNRRKEEPESVYLGGSLSLTGPSSSLSDCFIIPCPDTKLKMHVWDKARNVEIAGGQLDLDFTTEDESEVVKTGLVKGECGFAAVHYTVLRSAVMAQVDIKLLVKDDEDNGISSPSSRDICGSIVARCCNKYGFSNTDVAKEYFSNGNVEKECYSSRLLFEKPLSQFVPVENGTCIGLSRSLMAVPAYSSLIVEVDLWDHDTNLQIVNDSVEFPARHYGEIVKNLQGQDCALQVLVTWGHADTGLFGRTLQNKKEHGSINEEKEVKIPNTQRKRIQLRSVQPSSSNGCASSSKPKRQCPNPLMEVFSVFVGQNNNESPSLYGKIQVSYAFTKWFLFERDQNSPERLSPSRQIVSALDRRRSFRGPHLAILVDLMDAQSPLVINGSVKWNDFSINYPQSWYDKRICSVIRGEHGYAAIHYTIFPAAVQAVVKVCITTNESSDFYGEVYGSLVAQYSNFSYSTDYEKKYYRSVLFDKLQGNSAKLIGRDTTLSTSVIAVPIDSYLIIEVDMHLSSPPRVPRESGEDCRENGTSCVVEHLSAKAKFENNASGESFKTIQGHHYNINFVVEWTDGLEKEDLCP